MLVEVQLVLWWGAERGGGFIWAEEEESELTGWTVSGCACCDPW